MSDEAPTNTEKDYRQIALAALEKLATNAGGGQAAVAAAHVLLQHAEAQPQEQLISEDDLRDLRELLELNIDLEQRLRSFGHVLAAIVLEHGSITVSKEAMENAAASPAHVRSSRDETGALVLFVDEKGEPEQDLEAAHRVDPETLTAETDLDVVTPDDELDALQRQRPGLRV